MGMDVRKERTNWRDDKLVYFLEHQGIRVPSKNASFVMLEYDMSLAVSVIDYRFVSNNSGTLPSITLTELCNRGDSNVSYYTVQYSLDVNHFISFHVIAQNNRAQNILGEKDVLYTEEQYVDFLFRLRNRDTAKEIQFPLEKNTMSFELWEGEIVSHRHRLWGWNNPVIDLDLIISDENDLPVSVVEFKHERTKCDARKFKYSTSYSATKDLVDKSLRQIGYFFAVYNDSFTEFKVNAINDTGIRRIGSDQQVFDEHQFIRIIMTK